MNNIFQANDLVMQFGGLTAVNHFQMEINSQEIVGLIGPNGAGKTTVFNMITGVYNPTSGQVIFEGKDITGQRPDQIAYRGIARTFQNIRLMSNLSVLENVEIGEHLRLRSNWLSAVLRLPAYRREEQEIKERAHSLLQQVGLDKYAREKAGSLPYGAQRRLEIVRALATNPHLLLLDEPAAGMNPNEGLELMEFIREVQQRFKLTILLIEHDMRVVMGVCERIYVLDYGIVIAEGNPEQIQSNPRVIEAYLGVDE
ncbi:MAG: ABC transporter ATP-binding protein [Methylocystaceae bacterium]